MFVRLEGVLLLAICGCASSTRPQPPPTIWEANLPSPDGSWIAQARTIQNGGFGTASIYTIVYLKHSDEPGLGTQVLAFSCTGPASRPYVLDNKANAGGTIDLQMKWLSASHLEVTYANHPDLVSRVPEFNGIDITAREETGEKSDTSR
jgi:hypothetical protein